MLDRALPTVLEEVLERREAQHFVDVFREYTGRFLRLLSRLIEAGGPMS